MKTNIAIVDTVQQNITMPMKAHRLSFSLPYHGMVTFIPKNPLTTVNGINITVRTVRAFMTELRLFE